MMCIRILRLAHALLTKATHAAGWSSSLIASVKLGRLHWLGRRNGLPAPKSALFVLALRHELRFPSVEVGLSFFAEASLVLHHALLLHAALIVGVLHSALLFHILHPALLFSVLHAAPLFYVMHHPLLLDILHPPLFLQSPVIRNAAVIHATIIAHHTSPTIITWMHPKRLFLTQRLIPADVARVEAETTTNGVVVCVMRVVLRLAGWCLSKRLWRLGIWVGLQWLRWWTCSLALLLTLHKSSLLSRWLRRALSGERRRARMPNHSMRRW